MRSRNVVIAGGAILAAAALGYRAWDRGVFSGASGPAYVPWEDWGDPDRAREETDKTHHALRAAILAASPHNTQPWMFAVSRGEIAVHADRARNLGAFDPFRREMHIGVGCAIENFVIAARALGVSAEVRPTVGLLELSAAPTPVLAARIVLGATEPVRDELYDAIPKRHTNRGLYRDAAIAADRLRGFAELVSNAAVRIVFVTDDAPRRELAELIVKATEAIVADAEMSMDSAHWIRTGRREVQSHRDGVTIDASGTGPLMTVAGKLLPDLDAHVADQIWLKTTRNVHTASAPVFGVLLVRDRFQMASAIAAGRAWQRLHLAVTAQGLAAQPLNQPVEMMDRNEMQGRTDEFGPALASLARIEGWEPTFVFRMGLARDEAPRSPRRALEDVLVA